MDRGDKIFIVFLVIFGVLFILGMVFYEPCNEKGTCKRGDCSVGNYNIENCQRMIDSDNAQTKIAFSCEGSINKYISENNLTCIMSSISAKPLDFQRTKYKCCRTCYFINENGSDYAKEVCKI